MFGKQKCTTMKIVLVILGVCCCLLSTTSEAKGLSDYRLCADPQCQTIISMGSGKIRYTAGEPGMVSFAINSNIRVKSKSAGNNPKLWGIEVNGREGYAPKEYIMEKKVFKKDSELIYKVPVKVPDPILPAAKKPSPEVAALKSSETLGESKEGVKLTTPSNEALVNIVEQELTTPTHVQHKIEMVDGTPIPVLDKIMDKPSMSIENQNAESSEKESSREEYKVKTKVDAVENPSEILEEIHESAKDILQSHKRKVLTIESFGASDEENVIEDDDDDDDEDEDDDEDDDDGFNENENGNKENNGDQAKTAGEESVFEEETGKIVGKEVQKVVQEDVQEVIHEKDTEKVLIEEVNVGKDEKEGEKELKTDVKKIEEKGPITSEILLTKLPHILEPLLNDNNVVTSSAQTQNANVEISTEHAALFKDIQGNKKIDASPNDEEPIPTIGSMQNDEEEEKHTPEFNKTKSEDSKENFLDDMENKIANEQPERKPEFPTQPHTETSAGTNSDVVKVESTTVPSVTESGYQHNVDPRLEDFDTTTVPTVLLPSTQTQAPETLASGVTVTPMLSTANIKTATTSEEVPTNDELYSERLIKVPNIKADVVAADAKETQRISSATTESPKPPEFSPIASYEKVEAKVAEKNTLPLFQNHDYHYQYQQAQNAHQHQPSPHQHNYEYQYQYPEATSENAQNSEINETKVNTEVNTEAMHFKQTGSGEILTPVSDTELSNEKLNVDELKPLQNFDQLTSEEKHSLQKLEALTAADNDNNSDVEISSVEDGTSTHTTSQPLVAEPAPFEHEPEAASSENVLHEELKEKEQGLFATILGTVNSFLSNVKKENKVVRDEELNSILFPDSSKKSIESDEEYCEKLSPNNCPSRAVRDLHEAARSSSIAGCQLDLNNMSMDMLLTVAGNKMFEMSELLACLATVSVTCLLFLFVYYCLCNSSREGELLAKLNMLERSLLATHKENAILKEDLVGTRTKLSSIEDNSFGSNDMVMSLKRELEEEVQEKRQLQEQVGNLEKELENAAEAGLELNKIVSELLNNQSGDESIISSVEELQKQLNEQQKTILDINANLAEKSRENSELQLMIAEQNARLSGEIASLQQDNDELEVEKSNLQTRLEEMKREFEEDITKALEGKNFEIKRLQSELVELRARIEAEHTKYQTSLAKVEALEECLRTVRRDPNVNINQVIDVANVRAELLDMQKRYATLKERFDMEADGKKLAEEQLQLASSENEKLKHDFHQSEKDKLEAQTRLEVLSNYFKEKETQLQKELSLKEAMWLKQQGETTSTVDRLTTMQEEIQALKSQNDALRAEIEAQLAAHKAQTGTLENRAHETWLAARQSERRYEEARAEATALRRKLTALAGVGAGGVTTGDGNFDKLTGAELNNAPSPIHMETPGSPLMGHLPPPPFLPPPFMGPPPPFMGMPPPPFVPPGEMRPPPLGRLMSPPPGGAGSGGSGGSGHLPPLPPHSLRGGRYSPNRTNYDDYDDDEDDDDDDDDEYADDDDDVDDDEELEDERGMRQRRRRRGSDLNGSWRRDNSYSPPPRAYRSQSPTDSRYNYTAERDLIPTYDTETDFEPSPRKHERRGVRRGGGSRTSSYRDYSPPPSASSPLNASSNSNNAGKKHSVSAFNKVQMSSGSEKSYNSPPQQRHGGKKSGKSAV